MENENPKIALTERQREIITLAGEQLSSKQIADKLGISTRTVEDHRKKIMKSLGAKNFAGVINYYQSLIRKEQEEKDYEMLYQMHVNLTNTLNEAGSWRNALTLHRTS
jgi:DNA-binding CsgD family transcriptional regulator